MNNLIVVPAYNEEGCLLKTLESLQILPQGFEILVVDDGSTDATGELALAMSKESPIQLHVVRLPTNCGIGVAVQTGYRFAAERGTYRYVIQYDGDGQHDANFVPDLIRNCEYQQLDLCIGSRFLSSTSQTAGFRSTAARRVGIRFLAWLITRLTGVRVTDPTSGFRCAGPSAWRRFSRDYPDDYPEPESLARCCRAGLRVGEISVRMLPRTAGRSCIRHLIGIYYMLKVSLALVVGRLQREEFIK